MIKTKKPDIDDFIKGATAEQDITKQKENNEELVKYLLRLPDDLRKELRHEAIEKNINMSQYICSILEKRKELLITFKNN
jgi:hypothetical protein